AVHRVVDAALLFVCFFSTATAPTQLYALSLHDALPIFSRREDGTWLEIGIHEGRNRQVRRMAKAVGLSVRRLIRIAYGPLRLGNLPPGKFRFLKESEVAALKQSVQLDAGTG